MVVVVRDRGPVGIILLVISLLSLISLIVVIFLIMQGRGNVMVVAIPGFPLESVLAGLVVGLFIVARRRFARRKNT
ncbi:MAG: Loki-CTERM sorting domain-containing protein [Candidatus Bathyarchaeia archaeon]|jgi:membrane protein implicated in regulation of membrane protease activity